MSTNGILQAASNIVANFTNDNSGILNFDGTEDYVSTTTQYNTADFPNFSIGCWFRTTDSNSGKLIGFETNQTSTTSSSYDRMLYVGTDGKLRFGTWNPTTEETIVSSIESINDNYWHYVVGTYDGASMTLYVDGVAVATASAITPSNYLGYWRIGGYKLNGWPSASNGYFVGKIAGVHVYNKTLTNFEVATNFTARKSRYFTKADPTISFGNITSTSISGTVNEVLDSSGLFATSYKLQRSTSISGPWIDLNVTTKQFTDSGLSDSTTYYYRAKFTQNNGATSNWGTTASSSTLTGTVAPPPPPPPPPPPSALVFPRVGTIGIGSHRYNLEAWQQGAAKFDLVVWGIWENWAAGGSDTFVNFAQACANVKAINPNTKIFQYINPDAVDFGAVQGTRPVLYDAINTNNWWLRKTHPSGEIVLVDSGSILNRTTYTPTLNGQIFSEWIMSTYVRDMYVNGVYANTSGFPKANPYIDGFFWDQIFLMPEGNGDWNRDGTTDSQRDLVIGEKFREGIILGRNAYKAAFPNLDIFGNTTGFTMTYNPLNLPYPLPVYNKQFDFGLLEWFTGKEYSIDEWGSANTLVEGSRKHADQLASTEKQFCHSIRRYTLTSTSTNYQDFRFAFAGGLCLSDGYFGYCDGDDRYITTTGFDGSARWFDEYDNAGKQKYYLGTAIDPRVTTTWTQGVYRRRFANGWVLWNPRGNGIKTIQLGQSMKKIQGRSGFSDTAINNGATVTEVTLQDRDGIVLLNAQASSSWFPDWPTMRVNSGNGLENELLSSSRTTENKQFNLESYSRYDTIGPATPVYAPTLDLLNTFYDLYKSVKDKRAQANKPFTVKILPYFSIEIYKAGEFTARGQFYQLIEGKPFTDSVVKQYVDSGGGQPQWWLRTVKPVGSLGQQVEAQYAPNLWNANPATHLIPRNNKNETLAEGYARIQQELFSVPLTSGRTKLIDLIDGFWMDVVSFVPQEYKINNGATTVQVDYDQNGVADSRSDFTINNSNFSAEGGAIKEQRGYVFFKNAFKQRFPNFMFGSNSVEYAEDLINLSGNAGLAANSPQTGQFEYAMHEVTNWTFGFGAVGLGFDVRNAFGNFSSGNKMMALMQVCLAPDEASVSGRTFVQAILHNVETGTDQRFRIAKELYRFLFGIAMLHSKVAIGMISNNGSNDKVFDIDDMHWYLGNPKQNRSMGTLDLSKSQYFDANPNSWTMRAPNATNGSAQFWWEEFDNGLVVVRGDYTGYSTNQQYYDYSNPGSLTAINCPLPNPGAGYKWAFIPTSFTNPNTGLRSRNLDPTINNGADCTGGTYGQVSMFPATARVLRRAPI